MTLRRAAALLAALLLLALALLGAGFFPQEPLRLLAERQLRLALSSPGAPAQVSIGRLHVVPGWLQVEARDVRLEARGLRAQLPLVRVGLSPLVLRGQLAVRSLAIERPQLELAAVPESASAGSSAPTALPPLSVDRVSITGGGFAYHFAGTAGRLDLDGVELAGSLGGGSLALRARGGSWTADQRRLGLGPMSAQLASRPDLTLTLAALRVETAGGAWLTASGPLGRPPALEPDLRFEARLSLAEAAALGGLTETRGDAAIEGRLHGPLDALELEARLTGRSWRIAAWPVDRLRLDVEHRTAASSATLEADLLGGGASGSARLAAGRLEADLQLRGVQLEALARALSPNASGAPPAVGGRLDARLSARGEPRAPLRARAQLDATLRFGGVDGRLSASAQGPFTLPDGLEAAWQASLELAAPPPAPAPGFSSATLRADGRWSGLASPTVRGRLDGEVVVATLAPDALPIPLHAELDWREGRLDARADATVASGRLTAAASLAGSRIETAEFSAEAVEISRLLPGAGGVLAARAQARGTLEAPSVEASLEATGVTWREARLGALRVELAQGPRDGRWSARLDGLGASASGRLALGEAPRASGTLELERTPLASLAQLLGGAALEGSLTAQARFDVPIGHPQAATAELELRQLDGRYGALTLANPTPWHLRLADGRLFVDALALAVAQARLELAGSAALSRTGPLDLRLQGHAELGTLPAPEGWRLGGRVSADLHAGGTRANPDLSGTVNGAGATAQLPSLPALELVAARLAFDGDAVVVSDLRGRLANGTFALAGRVPLAALVPEARARPGPPSGAEAADLRLTWEGLEADALLSARSPDTAPGVYADLTGALSLHGGLARLDELSARLEVPTTAVSAAEVPITVPAFAVTLEDGRVATDGIALEGEQGVLRAAGWVDVALRRVDASLRGRLALRALSPFLPETSVSGDLDLDLAVAGPLEAPVPSGTARIAHGTLRSAAFGQAVTEIEGAIRLADGRLDVESLAGQLGGGPMTLAGEATLAGLALERLDLRLTGRDLLLRYPTHLRARLDAELRLTGEPEALTLSGDVRARRGLYDLDAALRESLTSAPVVAESSPLLRRFALDLRVETPGPVLVRSSLADAQGTGTLSLRGTLEDPAPYGRIEVLPGGRLYVQGREFVFERGRLEYAGTWNPELAFVATTRVQETGFNRDYEVRVTVAGDMEAPRVDFSSTPELSQQDVFSLVATGRRRGEAFADSAWIAGEQTAAFLAGWISQDLSRQLRSLGLDEVRIQPELLARETDPSARFTFGKNLTPELKLVYSLSLKSAEERFIQLEATPWRGVTLLGQRREDGTLTGGAGQRLELWGPPRPSLGAAEEKVRLEAVELAGALPLPEAELRRSLRAHAGAAVTGWDVQEDADRLRRRLREADYLEAEVAARLDGRTARFTLRSGPRFSWQVKGSPAPPALDAAIRAASFEDEALAAGRAKLLETLRAQGHLMATVETRSESVGSARRLEFVVEPGPRLAGADVRFEGAQALSRDVLLAAAGGAGALIGEPRQARERLEQAYRRRFYLRAEVGAPELERQGGRAVVRVPITEGPRARLAAVGFDGATRPEPELRARAQLATGEPFAEDAVLAATRRLREDYYAHGYPEVRVTPELEPREADLAVVFRIREGERRSVDSVELVGVERTRPDLVRARAGIAPGDPVDPRTLARAERDLLALGTFDRVAVLRDEQLPGRVRVDVAERAPLALFYQFRYNDVDRLSLQLDGEVRNLFGRGLDLGARYALARDRGERRVSLRLPGFLGAGDLTLSGFETTEDFEARDDLGGGELITVTRRQRGFELQQAARLPRRLNLLYGYSFKRVSDDQQPAPQDVASLNVSLVQDVRDNALDARSGRFLSLNLELSPDWLGSTSDFVKGFGQAFFALPLGDTLTWAHGYRLGLAKALGDGPVLYSERFRAGGSYSLRGFATYSVGPSDLGEPLGGEAIVVMNQELRYRHRIGVGAVAFWDAGNVFPELGELGLDLRHSLGMGLRWDSPVGLLRLDLGFPLARREGEDAYQLFFSLGQAF